jgi:hypothetical protein
MSRNESREPSDASARSTSTEAAAKKALRTFYVSGIRD